MSLPAAPRRGLPAVLPGEAAFFRRCLAVSAALHGLFFLAGRGFQTPGSKPSPVEIDLTQPFLGDGPAKLGAPKRLVPQAPPGPALPAETKEPPKEVRPEPPKEWTLPGPQTKAVEAPQEPAPTPGGAPEGTGTSPLPGGSGEGADYGEPGGRGSGGAALLSLPRLLNRDEVLANLRRFYPESERRAGREGSVLVNLHIGADGKVSGVDIVESAGTAFDAAAQQVGKLMRFSPAMGKKGPVPVKVSQSMVFRLQDE